MHQSPPSADQTPSPIAARNNIRRRFLTASLIVGLVAVLAIAAFAVLHRGNKSLARARSYVSCMRSHGLPTFPEPTSVGGTVSISTPPALQHSRAYPAAQAACQQLLPSAG